MRAAGVTALVLLLTLGVGAATAQAEQLSMTFTEDRANVGVQLSDEAMFEAPDVAPFGAQVDPASGAITNGQLAVPDFFTHITDPERDVLVEFDIGEISGSYDAETGALALSGTAGGTLHSEGKSCTVATVPAVLTLSTATEATAGGSPRSGEPFTAGLAGDGSIAGAWADMLAEPVDDTDTSFCENVGDRIGGPGGVWLQQEDVTAPDPPQLIATDPASPDQVGSPHVLGAAEAGSTVSIYAGPACAGPPLSTASAAELEAPGIAVAVAEGETATFTATATDAAPDASPCSAPITYRRLEAPSKSERACHKAERRQERRRHRVRQARRKIHRAQVRIERTSSKRRTKRLRATKRSWRRKLDRRRLALREAKGETRRICQRAERG